MILGSGSAVISGAQTQSYNIDIGSGNFNINGLSGDGVIDMGSGYGTIAYKEYNGDCKVDIGSGTLKLYVPEESNIEIGADIGSGSVNIDASGVSTKLNSSNDDEPVIIGNGEHPLFVDMGSGRVYVFDLSAYTKPVINEIVIPEENSPQSSIQQIGSVIIVDENTSIVSGIEIAEVIPSVIPGGSDQPEFSSTFIDNATMEGTDTATL